MDSTAISQIELKRIDVAVIQSHERRDDLKAAQDEADEWQEKYWNYRLESKERELLIKEEMLLLKLEIAQLREVVKNRTERLRLYEKDPDDTPRP